MLVLLVGTVVLLCSIGPAQGLQLKGCSRQGASAPMHKRSLLEKSFPPDTFNTPNLTPELLQQLEGAWNSTLAEFTCPLSTAECGYAASSQHKPGSLGSCAIVGLGAGLRHHRFGADIDGHDTVFRMGYVPIRPFAAHVGSKTDVMFLKLPTNYAGEHMGVDRYSTKKPEHTPSRFYLSFTYSCTTGSFEDKDVLLVQMLPPGDYKGCETGFASRQPWVRENDSRVDSGFFIRAAQRFYQPLEKYRQRNFVFKGKDQKSRRKEANLRQIHLTTGFSLITSVLASGLCTSMDVYGFSSVPSLKYFASKDGARNHTPRPGHVLGLENYLLQVAQHLDLLCIYADK